MTGAAHGRFLQRPDRHYDPAVPRHIVPGAAGRVTAAVRGPVTGPRGPDPRCLLRPLLLPAPAFQPAAPLDSGTKHELCSLFVLASGRSSCFGPWLRKLPRWRRFRYFLGCWPFGSRCSRCCKWRGVSVAYRVVACVMSPPGSGRRPARVWTRPPHRGGDRKTAASIDGFCATRRARPGRAPRNL